MIVIIFFAILLKPQPLESELNILKMLNSSIFFIGNIFLLPFV